MYHIDNRSLILHRPPADPLPPPRITPPPPPYGQTLEQARVEVEREHELESIQQAADKLTHERAAEAKRVLELAEAAVLAEREKAELRRRRIEEAKERRVAKEKVACLQLVRQIFPFALEGACEELGRKSWTTQCVKQVIYVQHTFWGCMCRSEVKQATQKSCNMYMQGVSQWRADKSVCVCKGARLRRADDTSPGSAHAGTFFKDVGKSKT